MNSNSRGQNRRIDLVFRPRARTVQPSFFDDPDYDPLSDDDLAAAAAAAAVFGDDDDDYLVAAPAHGSSSSSKRPHVAAASEEAILRLQEVTGRSRLGSAGEEQCAVCRQDFRADETLRAMPCSHAFHQHCISEWLRRNAVCPLCRCRLPEEEEEDKQRRKIDL